MPNHERFIALLRGEQGRTLGVHFAARLGESPGNWSRLRRGETRPTGTVYMRALVAFPHRRLEIMSCWRGEEEPADHGETALAS